jgi:hypothetical protein
MNYKYDKNKNIIFWLFVLPINILINGILSRYLKKNGILFHFIYINYFYLNNSTISDKILKLDFIRELFSLN